MCAGSIKSYNAPIVQYTYRGSETIEGTSVARRSACGWIGAPLSVRPDKRVQVLYVADPKKGTSR